MKSCNYLLSLSAVYFTFTEIHIKKFIIVLVDLYMPLILAW